jgi:hypothetical protein
MHRGHRAAGGSGKLASGIARARFALGAFATDLAPAQAAGYNLQITQMMPGMGYHYMNPDVKVVRRAPPSDPRLRAQGKSGAARGRRVGVPDPAGQAAAARRPVRLLSCRLPLRRRNLHAPERRGGVREDQP